MEKLKPVEDILNPDPRNLAFVRLDTGKPLTLEEHYSEIDCIQLNTTVPDDVRSYFATIQNLYVYAWFSYDLYPFVMFHCWAVIEMALRLRFPHRGRLNKRTPDKRHLGTLLKEAFKNKAIREKGFSRYRELRKRFAFGLQQERAWRRAIGTYPRVTRPVRIGFEESLQRYLTGRRNSWAHPQYTPIVVPGEATGELFLAADFINQLFPQPIKK